MATISASIKQEKVPFLHYPSPRKPDPALKDCLVFFIPGNPGLASYYVPFLAALRQLLDEREQTTNCQYAYHIYARNLLGFSDDDHAPGFGSQATGTPLGTPAAATVAPFSLEQQITSLALTVVDLQTLSSTVKYDQVLLIGHSVGAYMALELFHRHHLSCPSVSPAFHSLPLQSGILLFPTISHIARSPSGQKLNLLATYSVLDTYAHVLAQSFLSLLPASFLSFVVRKIMKFPPHAADATLSFLRSRDGVWQALHMGKDEMRTIAEERWQKDFWETAESEAAAAIEGKGSKFYFYFAERDHWVADQCRDEFIAAREKHADGKTTVVLGVGEDIPHAFCIYHSETVAEKVKVWIDEITGQ